MAPIEPEAAAGQTIAGRYELVQQIARGGMGTVWVATDHKLGRRVALKVMRRESLEAFDDARERFEREARAAAALGTAHVVQVHDYGVEDGVPFIAMEYLEGESLKARLERQGTLSILETSEVLGQVAMGLKAAHKAGLVHRDLKPSNIFITHRDDREVVKLLDFGVVKTVMARGAEETASGILLGTPQFMSPEQARGLRKIDHRADLWSLGVILYVMLTGENPFDSVAEAVGDIVIRVCIEPISAPSVFNPDLSDRIDEFFERALERDPDARFQSAEELTEGFMLAAELTFAGLDEAKARASGGALDEASEDSGEKEVGDVALGAAAEEASAPDQRLADADDAVSGGQAVVDEPSSLGSSMSTNVGAPSGARRSPMLMAVTMLAAVGVAYAAYAWMGEPSPVEPAGEPSASAPAPPETASASAATAAVPAPAAASASVSSTAEPAPSAPPVGPKPPPAVGPKPSWPPPTATTTADPPEDDGPPKWFPDQESDDGAKKKGASAPNP